MTFNTLRMIERLKLHFDSTITDIERMEKGFSNHVYKFSVSNRKYIYKEYNEENKNELNMLKRISIPKIVLNDPSYRIEEYIEHEECDYIKHMEEIVEAMKELHSLDTTGIEDFSALINRLYVKAVSSLDCKLVDVSVNKKDNKVYDDATYSIEQKVKMLEEIKNRADILYNDNKHKEGLCHNDLQPNNMLKIKDKMAIIDYEHSTVGDVLFDIANVFNSTNYDYNEFFHDTKKGYKRKDEEKFLRLYFGEFKEYIWKKVNNYKIVHHIFCFLWGIPRTNLKTDMDVIYQRYTLEKIELMKKANFLNQEEYMILISIVVTKN